MNPRLVRWLRVLSQVGFFVLLALVAAGAVCSFTLADDFNWVCPVAFLEISVSKAAIEWSAFYGAVLLVAVTFFLGRAFCSWACPVGTILDGVRSLLRLFPGRRSARRFGAPGGRNRPARNIKYGVLVGAVAGAAATGAPVFCPVCPIGTTCRSAGLQGVMGGVEMAVLPAVASMELYKDRTWCRYYCPVGAVLALVDRVTGSRMRLPASRCLSCGRCDHFCPMENQPLQDTARALRRDPAVIRAALAAGRPDVMYRPVRHRDLPEEVQKAMARQERQYRIPGGECTRCFECKAACPATRLQA